MPSENAPWKGLPLSAVTNANFHGCLNFLGRVASGWHLSTPHAAVTSAALHTSPLACVTTTVSMTGAAVAAGTVAAGTTAVAGEQAATISTITRAARKNLGALGFIVFSTPC